MLEYTAIPTISQMSSMKGTDKGGVIIPIINISIIP